MIMHRINYIGVGKMAFKSQLKQSKLTTRRGSKASIVVSQTYKPSTKSEEFSVRISADLMGKIGLLMGDKVDVLRDEECDLWMIQKCGSDGFTVAGKDEAPTGLIRYTLKPGHERLSENRADLPIKLECDESSLKIADGSVIFSLISDD